MCSEPGSYGKDKKDVVIYSDPTDSKGYFHVALTNIKDLLHCRVKLYTSPVGTCNNPTNVNKGIAGVPLSMYGYRYHSDKNLKIFSVGPFYFTGYKPALTTPKYWSWWSRYDCNDLACIISEIALRIFFFFWKLVLRNVFLFLCTDFINCLVTLLFDYFLCGFI